ncbi:MAG: type I-MYXAN CRISPR-associated protein Cas6/Cmx6 [Chromatiaceae bacterium]|nr:type I-MYXAN CRISPR-associated protein Cas6/Cmx6 [Chromatiaceae bacterium]MBP6734672.1 type I-MYXAN CRISPR-associated protein Cas6/Cmx6 [Chromatiaceae bacterium]MBP7983819.1 type I-MYXAN CRISPR-associated protein Cas6/Cmx6 [Chromatiaceae bacterium]
MFWQEDPSEQTCEVTEDVVDILFAIDCKRLPVDHAHALSSAIIQALPWFGDEDDAGVHSIHVAGSQNGWERPTPGADSYLIVSRRTKLAIRLRQERLDDLIQGLRGRTLDVAGCPLIIGEAKLRPLSKETTLLARYVVSQDGDDEEAFLTRMARELYHLNIGVRKALCGKTTTLIIPGGGLQTRSLLLADLSPAESIRLQVTGLGPHRSMGCGLFIPHKGIDSVRK